MSELHEEKCDRYRRERDDLRARNRKETFALVVKELRAAIKKAQQ